MPIPDYQSLMLPVLQRAADGERQVPEIADQIADELELTQAERDQLLPSGRQRLLHNRIHWAKFYMTKAGLIESPRRGRFSITDLGRQLLAKNPQRINNELLLTYPMFSEFYRSEAAAPDQNATAGPEVASAPLSTPEEMIEKAYEALQSALKGELLSRVLQNTPTFFENVIVDLLVAMGYGGSHRNASQQLGRTGDGGVDGVINEDRLGLDRVYVQAKRYAPGNSVGRPEIQAFIGSLVGLGANKGVFVTTSSFSAQAVEYASRIPQRVILIDGRKLSELMVEHNVGVRMGRQIEFKRLDEDFFAED